MAVDTNTKGLRVPFGLKQGRLYPPQMTDRGLACECVCPGCGSALIANQGIHRRPYFSHHQSQECVHGYESAAHMMAKQIIQVSKYIVVPEYSKTIQRKMPTGDILSETIFIPSTRVDFVDIQVEQTLDGLRPDVIGMTSNGVEILIEVYVTHAVTDDKRERFSKKNLIELDLRLLQPDLVADETLFAEKVLSGADREWISCHLYREEIKIARHTLRENVRRFINEHRTRIEQANIERLAAIERSKQKAQIDERRSQLREKNSHLLDRLKTQALNHGHNDQGLEMEKVRAIAQQLGVVELPTLLSYKQKEDWIFKAHRSIWQAFVYEKFIQGKPLITLYANDVKRAVVREFGMLEWIQELINLKYQQKVQGSNRGQWYGKKGVWFFTDAENRMIPSPYLLILNYLKRLTHEGMLTLKHPDSDSFTVKFDSFSALASYRAEQTAQARLIEQERQKTVIAENERLRQADIDRRKKYAEDSEKRIVQLIALAECLLATKGERDVNMCNQCSHIQEKVDGDFCLECTLSQLFEVNLTFLFLKQLPHRLRSLRLFPPAQDSGKAN